MVRAFGRVLLAELLKTGVVVGPVEMALVQTVCRCEMKARLAQRWLADAMDAATAKGESFDMGMRLALLKAVTDGSRERDAAMKQLGLTMPKGRDPFAGIFDASTTNGAKP